MRDQGWGGGSGGKGSRSGTAGRGFKVSVGERAVQEQAPLGRLLFSTRLACARQGSSSLCLCCPVCVVCLLCLRTSLDLDVLVALGAQGAPHAPRAPSLGSSMAVLLGIAPIGCRFSCVTSVDRSCASEVSGQSSFCGVVPGCVSSSVLQLSIVVDWDDFSAP